MPTLQVHDQTLYYETYGPPKGAVVLLMHGWMQVGRDLLALADSLIGRGFRVVLPDLPGYGRSAPPPRRFPPDFYFRDAQYMGAFLKALQIEQAHVVGYSDGGEVALLMPILFPRLCRSVAAWAAIGAYDAAFVDYIQRQMPRLAPSPGQRARHPGQPVENWQGEWIGAVTSLVRSGGDLSLSRAGEIACPLLLMVGEHDPLNPVASARRFVEAVGAHATLKVFDGAGHEIHDQQPGRFVAALLEFLRGA
ncbi:MAG: alpha/beta hydrolase [Anaerolineae bacterium]|nr:alpha/beta hydrolase [Anaerolineae bacterium]